MKPSTPLYFAINDNNYRSNGAAKLQPLFHLTTIFFILFLIKYTKAY